jgi:hypothetical protein
MGSGRKTYQGDAARNDSRAEAKGKDQRGKAESVVVLCRDEVQDRQCRRESPGSGMLSIVSNVFAEGLSACLSSDPYGPSTLPRRWKQLPGRLSKRRILPQQQRSGRLFAVPTVLERDRLYRRRIPREPEIERGGDRRRHISRQAGNQQQHERRCGRGQRDDRRQDQRGLQPVLVLGSRMSLDRRIGVCIVIRGGGIGLYV